MEHTQSSTMMRSKQPQTSQSTEADTGASYPPRVRTAAHSHSLNAPSSSVQRKLFGPKGIASFTIDTGPLSQSPQSPKETAATSTASTSSGSRVKRGRWHTREFRFYALVFLIMVPIMVWVPIELSQPTNRNYPRYAWHLKPGWIPGRRRDDSDFQYRSFRDYLIPLTAIMGVYLLVSKAFAAAGKSSTYQRVGSSTSNFLPPAPKNRHAFLMLLTAIFVLALHGTNTLKLLFVVLANYVLANTLGGRSVLAPVAIWLFNVGTLFAVHWKEGFRYSDLWSGLSLLEEYQGLLPRWQINFNITMLRLVSYSMDLHWARQQGFGQTMPTQSDGETPRHEPTPRERCSKPRPQDGYGFTDYVLYALYPPLFIAGPIMTFNDFSAQLYQPTRIARRTVVSYAVRLVICLLTMEFVLHFMYVNAIKDSKAWEGATALELSMIGFWNLIVVWLKLLIPWRFFRLWAMADGVDAPENMVRCMANNYSTLGFWRSWHRSYNLWIVRYIYVPVGGGKNKIVATLLVFTFVALWHDLSLKLLTWGWLVTFFIVPELVCRAVISEKKVSCAPTSHSAYKLTSLAC